MLDIRDIFDHPLEPGDIFLYCPGSKRNADLRVGVFIGVQLDQRGNSKVSVRLITKQGMGPAAHIRPEIFSSRCALIANPEFSINSPLIKNAIKLVDELKDAGTI